MPSDGGGTGKAHQWNPAVLDQLLADGVWRTNHQIENAFQIVAVQHAIAQLLDGDGSQGSLWRLPPQDAIAAYGGNHRIPRPHGHGEVERSDHSGNTQRV